MQTTPFLTHNQRTIFYSLTPGEGAPLIFLNGLSDSLTSWEMIAKNLQTPRPLLFIDLLGQGESLEVELKNEMLLPYDISIDQQVDIIEALLKELKFDKFGLIGFSYGGGLALKMASLFSARITDLILILPFMLRLDLSFPLSRVIKAQYDFWKSLTPKEFQFPYQVLENSYEKFTSRYMNFRYLKRIPSDQHREAAIALSQGIMRFNSFDVTHLLPDDSLIVMSAGMDTLIPASLYQEFWFRVSKEKKKAWVHFKDGEHLILEQAPEAIAHYLNEALAQRLFGIHKVSIAQEFGKPQSLAR